MAKPAQELLQLGDFEVGISNPDKVYFPQAGITKLELVRYYLAVQDGVLRALARRPMILKRYVNGAEGEPFYQKRAPENRPPYVDLATFTFPSGRHADEIVGRLDAIACATTRNGVKPIVCAASSDELPAGIAAAVRARAVAAPAADHLIRYVLVAAAALVLVLVGLAMIARRRLVTTKHARSSR